MEVFELSTENVLDLDRKNRKKIYQMGAVTEQKSLGRMWEHMLGGEKKS